jgi:hypothetical protein
MYLLGDFMPILHFPRRGALKYWHVIPTGAFNSCPTGEKTVFFSDPPGALNLWSIIPWRDFYYHFFTNKDINNQGLIIYVQGQENNGWKSYDEERFGGWNHSLIHWN